MIAFIDKKHMRTLKKCSKYDYCKNKVNTLKVLFES